MKPRTLAFIKESLEAIEKIVGAKVGLFRAAFPSGPHVMITDRSELETAVYSKDIGGAFLIKTLDAEKSRAVTSFSIRPFPGCCAFAISTGTVMYDPFFGRGINKHGLAIREEIARLVGYTALVCTDVTNNERERKTLSRRGFKDLITVLNRRTNNEVAISIKVLEQ